jgi:hypothetical protein
LTDPHDRQETRQQDPSDGGFASAEVQERAEREPTVWAEAADGRCSEDAALFAASQPAPLSIV